MLSYAALTNKVTMHKLVLLGLIPLLFACRNANTTDTSQGIITYKLDYSEEVQAKSFASFLPTTMITTYKKGDYKLSIQGNLSLYNLEYISCADGDSTATLFRIFDKHMFHKHGKEEFLFLFQNTEDSKLEFRNKESKVIAGLECKKAIVHFNNPDLEDITVYYSTDIDFKRPEENSPFDDIPGMLMAFSLSFKGLTINFEAQKIEYKKINDKVFLIPDKYSPSAHDEISELVSALIK